MAPLTIRPCHLLFVDPSSSDCWLYENMFNRDLFRISTAQTADQFLITFQQGRPFDLIIIDPKIFGDHVEEMFHWIAAQFPMEKVVLYSHQVQIPWVMLGKKLEISEYIKKGQYSPAELLTRFEEIIDWANENGKNHLELNKTCEDSYEKRLPYLI